MRQRGAMIHLRAGLASLALAAVIGCDSSTAPGDGSSSQPGFGSGTGQAYGQPRMLLSAKLALGRRYDVRVTSPTSPDSVNHRVARFRSSNGNVIAVGTDGQLHAKGLGETTITVDLDGRRDSARVEVIDGFPVAFLRTGANFLLRAVSDSGDLLGAEGLNYSVWSRRGEVIPIGGCSDPTAVNSRLEVACQMPNPAPPSCTGTTTAAIWRGGKVERLFGDSVESRIDGLSEGGVISGAMRRCDPWEYKARLYLGRPGEARGVTATYLNYNGSLGQPTDSGWAIASWYDGITSTKYAQVKDDPATIARALGGYSSGPQGSGGGVVSAAQNTRGDVLVVNDFRNPNPGHEWHVFWQPSGPAVSWPAASTGAFRCNYPRAVTDDRRISGLGLDGWCIIERDGRTTYPTDAMTASAAEAITLTGVYPPEAAWANPPIFAFYTRGGLIITYAKNAAGEDGIAIVRTH